MPTTIPNDSGLQNTKLFLLFINLKNGKTSKPKNMNLKAQLSSASQALPRVKKEKKINTNKYRASYL